VFRHFQKLSPAFHDEYTSGRVISRQTSDVDAIYEMLESGFDGLVTAVLTLVGTSILLLVLDVKLALVIGVVLGSIGLRYVGVAAACAVLFGGVGGIVALAMGRNRKAMIPFGPYMAAGAVVAAFWGERIADWYLGSFGA